MQKSQTTQQMSIEDDSSPLAVKKTGATDPLQDAETDPSEGDEKKNMAQPGILGTPNKRRSSYTPVPVGEVLDIKKPDISKMKITDIFSPKPEIDEKAGKNKANRSFIDLRKKNTEQVMVRSVTENVVPDLDPVELENILQLEMSNEEDVDDPKKVDKRRFLNDNKINIQSPIHHTIGGFFKDPAVDEKQKAAGILAKHIV